MKVLAVPLSVVVTRAGGSTLGSFTVEGEDSKGANEAEVMAAALMHIREIAKRRGLTQEEALEAATMAADLATVGVPLTEDTLRPGRRGGG